MRASLRRWLEGHFRRTVATRGGPRCDQAVSSKTLPVEPGRMMNWRLRYVIYHAASITPGNDASFTLSFALGRRIETRDPAAFRSGALVDDRVDQRRPPRADCFLQCAAQLGGSGRVHADAAERLHQLFVARILDEHER